MGWLELFQTMPISVFRPVCGSSHNVAIGVHLRRHHVHDVLVVFKKHARNRTSTWIRASKNEYANVAQRLAVRRRLAKCSRQRERWDDKPLSRLAILLQLSVVVRGARRHGGKEERRGEGRGG